MFFDDWASLGRVLTVGVLAYAGLIILLRGTGKRTLSKMNAFDFVVTVALGSTLATILLNADVSLAEGLLALALLCGLQYAVTFLSVRSGLVRGVVKAEPSLLYFEGRFLEAAMRRERVTRDELLAAARSEGAGGLDQVAAIALETDGTISVVRRAGDGQALPRAPDRA